MRQELKDPATVRRFLIGAVSALLLTSCGGRTQIAPVEQDADDSPGAVRIELELGSVGYLARASAMDPKTISMRLISDRLDTITRPDDEAHNRFWSMALPSNRTWTLVASVLDQNDSLLYLGSTRFALLPNQTFDINLALDPRYSSIRVGFPARGDLHRFSIQVDDIAWGDSTVPETGARPDSVIFHRDYLSASPAGTPHRISIRAHGRVDGIETALYGLDTTIFIVSTRRSSLPFVLRWIGPSSAPPGKAALSLLLGSVNQIGITLGYQSRGADIDTLIDARNGIAYPVRTIGDRKWMLADARATCTDPDRQYCPVQASELPNACPSGWRVPDTSEWHSLIRFASGGLSDSVGIRRLRSRTGWISWWRSSPSYSNGDDALDFHLSPNYSWGFNVQNGNNGEAHMGAQGAQFWTATEGARYFGTEDRSWWISATSGAGSGKPEYIGDPGVRCVEAPSAIDPRFVP
jgi:uncharacterized protein (TIGR02145 family)